MHAHACAHARTKPYAPQLELHDLEGKTVLEEVPVFRFFPQRWITADVAQIEPDEIPRYSDPD